MYDTGSGVVQDYKESARLYRLAAAQNHGEAQNNLGTMYGKGRGVKQDFIKAHMWYNLAAASGESNALKNRDIIAAKMTPQQIAEAQKLARECQARNFKNCD
jgi:TPR repeat protein